LEILISLLFMVIRHEASPFGTVESAERLVIAEAGALAAALLDSAMQPPSCLKVKFQSVGLFFLRIHGKFEGKSVRVCREPDPRSVHVRVRKCYCSDIPGAILDRWMASVEFTMPETRFRCNLLISSSWTVINEFPRKKDGDNGRTFRSWSGRCSKEQMLGKDSEKARS
jgi:hypothetical protein